MLFSYSGLASAQDAKPDPQDERVAIYRSSMDKYRKLEEKPEIFSERLAFANHSPETLRALAAPAESVADELKKPEAYWRLLTAPETPFAKRLAAACQFEKFPLEYLSQLMEAKTLLSKEKALHNWGFEPDISYSMMSRYFGRDWRVMPSLKKLNPEERKRIILGHEWLLPEKESPWPCNMKAASDAPWPWQLQIALDCLMRGLFSSFERSASYYGEPIPEVEERRKHWFEAAMKLPCSNDEEACRFIDAALSANPLTLAAFARWRRIALNKDFPNAAAYAARWTYSLRVQGEDEEKERMLKQILIADLLRSPAISEQSKFNLDSAVSCLRINPRSNGRKPPVTATVLLAECELALAKGEYAICHASSAFALLDSLPFELNYRSMNIQDYPVKLKEFEAWYKENKASLLKLQEAERPLCDEMRSLLDSFERMNSK